MAAIVIARTFQGGFALAASGRENCALFVRRTNAFRNGTYAIREALRPVTRRVLAIDAATRKVAAVFDLAEPPLASLVAGGWGVCH
jgi:hypothetical protein